LFVFCLHKFNLSSGGWGGSASLLKALHQALAELGHSVGVAAARRPDPFGLTTVELPLGADITFGPEKRPGERALNEIATAELQALAANAADRIAAEVFTEHSPDLLVANHINLMALTGWHLHRRFGVPYRIISYGTDTQLLLRDARYAELFGDAARNADRIFAISQYVAREVEATVGGRIEILGGAVDTRLFYPPPSLPKRNETFVYFGRLVTEKGLWTLLDAFEAQPRPMRLRIIGEGPLRDDLETSVQRRKMQDRVQFVGLLAPERLREELIGSMAAIVPSIWQEPLGLVVLEAMACGIPVIASAVGGIPEMITDGKNGLLVPPRDVFRLAEMIDCVARDETLYRRLRRGVSETMVPSYRDLAKRVIA
jgi:glycosyltransferase involved in cell wall biosynthesis